MIKGWGVTSAECGFRNAECKNLIKDEKAGTRYFTSKSTGFQIESTLTSPSSISRKISPAERTVAFLRSS